MQLTMWPIVCGGVAILVVSGVARAAPQHTISVAVDGRDELRISNGSLVVEHFSWSLPNSLVVDGVPQTLTWNGNTSSPIPVPITGDYWVEKTHGRDGGYAVQRNDGFALAASDNPNGGDVYEFQLFAAAGASTTDWMRVVGAGATPGRMNFSGVPGYATQSLGTETTFALTVDGTDELMFVNGSLVIRHLSWNNPASLTINGVPQPLTFNGGLSNPIPLTLPDDFQFTQLGGRTTLYPVQTPVGLLLSADDELLGADTYTWKLVAVPEPTSCIAVSTLLATLSRRRRQAKERSPVPQNTRRALPRGSTGGRQAVPYRMTEEWSG